MLSLFDADDFSVVLIMDCCSVKFLREAPRNLHRKVPAIILMMKARLTSFRGAPKNVGVTTKN